MASAEHILIVAGDVVVDHHVYAVESGSSSPAQGRGALVLRQPGGAALLHRLIDAALRDGARQTHARNVQALTEWWGAGSKGSVQRPKPAEAWEESWETRLGVAGPWLDEGSDGVHPFGMWRPHGRAARAPGQPRSDKAKEHVWRIAERMGYGDDEGARGPVAFAENDFLLPADVLVLDDGGLAFRERANKAHWHLPPEAPLPRWILLKMSGLMARGDLWHELISKFSERLVCVVSADELRREKLILGLGVSWERTLEEISSALGHSGEFRLLTNCAHLVVTFSADGALWIDQSTTKKPVATLVFDAGGAYGEFVAERRGEVFGYQTAMAAALAYALAAHATAARGATTAPPLDLAQATRSGLNAIRDLMDLGHGLVDPKSPLTGTNAPRGYPVERLVRALSRPADVFAVKEIHWPLVEILPPKEWRHWMIGEMLHQAPGVMHRPSLFGVAYDVLHRGTDVALKYIPHAKFGKLITADRQEIEALRNIRRLMREYRTKPASKPLSIGVFGPPGAGKSFGVKQVAKEVFDGQARDKSFEELTWLEFNLSQFRPDDLIGALHQVQGRALSGVIPVVFWDEFDSRAFEWLQYLLAPMQDGRFQQGQISHPVGSCVFIFAGGTSETFEKFCSLGQPGDPAARDFILRKGPDFRSRLDVTYDVRGPNQRLLPPEQSYPDVRRPDPADQGYVVRRALLILSMLETPGPLNDMDEGLVNALLREPAYTNGARSLEKLVLPLRTPSNDPIRRSRLPPPQQLAMHVKSVGDFYDLLSMRTDRDDEPRLRLVGELDLDNLAAAIHKTWRQLAIKQGWTMQPRFDRDFDKLDGIDQEDNRAAARRIPWILGLTGLGLARAPKPEDVPSPEEVQHLLKFHIERLAEAEHDGWMDFRLRNGWQRGESRDDEKKIHPLLILYSELPEHEQEKDRNTILHFPDFVNQAGYRIVWLESGTLE